MQQRATDPPLYRDTYREQWANVPIPAAYRPWATDQTRKLPEHVYSRQQIPSYDYVHDEESLREQHIRYCQTITGIDRVVGRVVEQLRALGELENTVIVYAADHGILSGEHGLGGKTLLYEPSLRIPFIVWDPSVPAARRGRVDSSFVVPADLGPFVLSRAGLPVPAAMQGRDLTPLVCGEAVPWRSDVFCEGLMTIQAYPRSEAVRDQRWKYIRYFIRAVGETEPETSWEKVQEPYATTIDASARGETPAFEELFDLHEDPHETVNLVDDPAYAEVLQSRRQRIGELLVACRGRRRLDELSGCVS